MTGREEDGNRRWFSAAKEQSVRSAQNGIAMGRTPEGITRSFTEKNNYITKSLCQRRYGQKTNEQEEKKQVAKSNGNAGNGGGMPAGRDKYRDGRWSVPSKRAKGYAEERKAKVHMYGQKEGKELTDYEAGIRSGYLQCQNDHAGMYKYKQAMDSGMSKREAANVSRMKKGWLERIKDFLSRKK